MIRKILLFIANIVLKRVLANKDFKQKQKDIVFLLNTFLDSIRDCKIDDSELTRIQDAFSRLTSNKVK